MRPVSSERNVRLLDLEVYVFQRKVHLPVTRFRSGHESKPVSFRLDSTHSIRATRSAIGQFLETNFPSRKLDQQLNFRERTWGFELRARTGDGHCAHGSRARARFGPVCPIYVGDNRYRSEARFRDEVRRPGTADSSCDTGRMSVIFYRARSALGRRP
jgi:hypothetical protein